MKTLLCLCLVLTAASIALAQDAPDTLIISHVNHFASEVDCTDCHTAAEEAAPTVMRPEMDACSACHDVDDDDTCNMCHTNVDEAGDYPERTYATLFAHGPHLGRDIACAVCHGTTESAEPAFPVKADCRVCHETANHYNDCRLCHRPEFDLTPVTHQADWAHAHGVQAQADETACFLCHTRTTCEDCHLGDNVRPRTHSLNFAFEHASKARGKEMDCAVCHREAEFCSSCHMAERVLPRDHFRGGWMGPDGGNHAVEARFDMESCIACHSAGADSPTCARCHGG